MDRPPHDTSPRSATGSRPRARPSRSTDAKHQRPSANRTGQTVMAELLPSRFEIPGEVQRPRSRGRREANTGVPIGPGRAAGLKARLPVGPADENLRKALRAKTRDTPCEH